MNHWKITENHLNTTKNRQESPKIIFYHENSRKNKKIPYFFTNFHLHSISSHLTDCVEYDPLHIDTPEKYEQLKQGKFNDEYLNIWITSDAHPDILLQPQFFEKSKFLEIRFISIRATANNTIILYPNEGRVDIEFNVGGNPLRGVPKKYGEYTIYFAYFPPTVENINSIVSWEEAKSLRIVDRHSVAVRLLKRIDEFSKLKKLKELDLRIEPHSYDQVNVTAFIENLPALKEMVLTGNQMTEIELQDFKARNKLPWNWRLVMFAQSFYYYKGMN